MVPAMPAGQSACLAGPAHQVQTYAMTAPLGTNTPTAGQVLQILTSVPQVINTPLANQSSFKTILLKATFLHHFYF